jgi:hypothetical protein
MNQHIFWDVVGWVLCPNNRAMWRIWVIWDMTLCHQVSVGGSASCWSLKVKVLRPLWCLEYRAPQCHIPEDLNCAKSSGLAAVLCVLYSLSLQSASILSPVNGSVMLFHVFVGQTGHIIYRYNKLQQLGLCCCLIAAARAWRMPFEETFRGLKQNFLVLSPCNLYWNIFHLT